MKKLAPCDNCYAKNLKMIKDHNNDEAVNNKKHTQCCSCANFDYDSKVIKMI